MVKLRASLCRFKSRYTTQPSGGSTGGTKNPCPRPPLI